MSIPNLLAKNIQLLALANPQLAEQILSVDSSHLHQYHTNDEPNLQVKQGDKTYFLHSPTGAKQEADKWFKNLKLQGRDILYVYGIGVGYFYQAALAWLHQNPSHRLVFLEDDLAVIKLLLETELGNLILQDLQVEIYDISRIEVDSSIGFSLVEDHALKASTLTVLPSYQREKNSFYAFLTNLILFETSEQDQRNKEIGDFGITFFNNYYSNLLKLPSSYLGQGLFGKFKNIPAIICGAGPSLIASIPYLKNLEARALLIGAGTAMNILNFHGIWPHFGINIDPFPETFHRLITNRAFETPTFYRNRLYYEALSAIHGPHLFLTGGGHYDVPKWFEKQLGLPSDKEQPPQGYNVVNAAIETAYSLGCNPIILVGLDSAFKPGQHYASGVEQHPLFPSSSPENKPFLGTPIPVKDRSGHSVLTYWTWIIEAHWTDVFQRDHPQTTIINASAAGIKLFSIPFQPLEEVIALYLNQTYDLHSLIHQSIQEAGLVPISEEKIKDCIHLFYDSLQRCKKHYQYLIEQITQLTHVDFSEEKKEEELSQEIGFIYLVKQFNEYFLNFTRQDRMSFKRLSSHPDKQLLLYKSYTIERYLFLLETIEIHFKIIENVLSTNQEQAKLPKKRGKKRSPSHIKQKENEKRYFYPKGALYSSQAYKNQLREGKHIYYYPDGTLKTEINYQMGQLNGPVKLYYPNGKLKRELHFKNNQRHGRETSWYANGQVFTEVNYENNEAKQARSWFPDGTLAKETFL